MKKGLFGNLKVVQTYETISGDSKKNDFEGMKNEVSGVDAKNKKHGYQR
ncbi:MAG: hypothetical protein ACKV1O_18370 [Saprospiraceae bacterium]